MLGTSCGAASAASAVERPAGTRPVAILPPSLPPSKLISPSFAPCSPFGSPSAGIDSNLVQVGPDSYEVFNTTNQWTGPVNGSQVRWYQVYAGATGPSATPPQVPAVWVNITTLTTDRCSASFVKVGMFTDAAADGALRLMSVNGSVVDLVTVNGQPVQFDLVSHQFGR
jgi:hypothetical protein